MTLATQLRRANQARSPNVIAGLRLWLKADAITGLVDNDPVVTWADSSGNGFDATQGTAGSRPLYKTGVQNGQPAIRFDGTDDFLAANGAAGVFNGNDLAFSAFFVAKTTTLATTGTFVSGGRASTSNPFVALQVDSATSGRWLGNRRDDAAAQITAGSGASSADTNWRVHAIVCPGTLIGWWADGTAKIGAGTNFNVGQTTCDQVGIGALFRATAGNFLNGDIAEVVLYNVAVTTEERRALQRWLGAKYGIAVP